MGDLYHEGPNYAADTVVTRRRTKNAPNEADFEVLVIKRKDNGKWALPGGFIDEGETAEEAAARELIEEAGIDLKQIEGRVVYKGKVDDHRNTPTSWIETTSVHKHVSEDMHLELVAGDDAADVRFIPTTDENLNSLHAGHGKFVRLALSL